MTENYQIRITPTALQIEVDFLADELVDELIEALRIMHLKKTLPEKLTVLETKGFDGKAREFAILLSKRVGRAFVICAEYDEAKKAYVVLDSMVPDMPVGTVLAG
jgi:hypothetical protein